MPFWQRDAETLPYFMRAAPLYAEGRWMELADLAERWAANNPRDAEPLRVRGDALEKLERPHSAAAAYTDALRLAPNDARSWYGLALVYAQAGNIAASQRAEDALANFDRDLAVRAHSEVQRLRALRKDSVAP